jgi:2-dehydro-3-deoxyphosphogalactonate aldolase
VTADPLAADGAIVAILRGLVPREAVAIGDALYRAGIRIIEVPLNSPDPYASIAALASSRGADCLIGAGTVLSVEAVARAHEAGANLIVAPNCDSAVIERAVARGLQVMPGVATPTEAFAALRAGASHLKLFPAAALGAGFLRALRDVLPSTVRVFPVGGIGPDDFQPWLEAGAAGFGIGSHLFRPGYSAEDVHARAQALVESIRRIRTKGTA